MYDLWELRSDFMSMFAVTTFINLIIFLGLLGISIYAFVLFVKLANRGIKALDIYINEKNNKY